MLLSTFKLILNVTDNKQPIKYSFNRGKQLKFLQKWLIVHKFPIFG